MTDKFIINDRLKNFKFLNYADGNLESTVKTISGNDIDLIVSRDTFIDFLHEYFDKILVVRTFEFSDKQFLVYLHDISVPLHFHVGLSFYGSENLEFTEIYSLYEKDQAACKELVNTMYCRYRFKPNLVYNTKYIFIYRNKYIRRLQTIWYSKNKMEYLISKFWRRNFYVFCHGVDGTGKSTLVSRLSEKIKPSTTSYFGLRKLLLVKMWNKCKNRLSIGTEQKVIKNSQKMTDAVAIKNEFLAILLVLEYLVRFNFLKISRSSSILIIDRSPVDLLFSKFKNTWAASQIYKIFPKSSVHLLLCGQPNIISSRGGEYDERVTEQMQTILRFSLTENIRDLRIISCDHSTRKVEQFSVTEILDCLIGT